jgi:uncharacterized protein (TIGR03437 family)
MEIRYRGLLTKSVILCCLVPFAHAQLVQQGPKLLGTGVVGPRNGGQGSATAISADGNTIAFSGTADNNYTGAVWVFTRTNGVWSQQGAKLVCPDGFTELFGISIGLSADGNDLIVGQNGQSNGAWVFTRTNGAWQFQQKLTASQGTVGQGYSVAISGEGNTAILGDPNYNLVTINGRSGTSGAAWVFVRNGSGVWSLQQSLVGSNMLSPAGQGGAVALSMDGNTAVLGGMWDNNPGGSSVGAAWIFTRSGGAWDPGTKIVGQTTGLCRQGSAVAISSDGNTVIVGGPYGTGGAWVFSRGNGAWTQQAGPLAGPNADKFSGDGTSVSLNADGNAAVIGGPGGNYASLFMRTNGAWKLAQQISGSQILSVFSQFGSATSISADTTTVAVGGPLDGPQNNTGLGAVWMFYAPPEAVTASVGTPQLALVGSPFATNLQATVTNTLSYPAPGVQVTFTAPSTGPGGAFQGFTNVATAATNAAGVAIAPIFTANNTVGGPYTVEATVASINVPADFELTNAPAAVNVSLQTSPPNLLVSLDNSKFVTAPLTQALVPGSIHAIATQSPQPAGAGVQYTFASWSDGLALSHSITVPASDAVYTATFKTSAPAIGSGGIVNAATNAPPAANGGIAEGSIVAIYGTGLGPATPVNATALPLSDSMADVTATITSGNGAALKLYMVYVSAGQINAIIPSVTPEGAANVVITYKGISSEPIPIQIVHSSFGIFTGSFGSGAAAAIDLNTKDPYISETNPAQPGDYIILFGTGLGPVSVPDNQAPGGAISPAGISVQVVLGNQTINAIYAGRSFQFPGLDQINFQIPASATTSNACAVPLAVVVNGVRSNPATLTMVNNSSACTP